MRGAVPISFHESTRGTEKRFLSKVAKQSEGRTVQGKEGDSGEKQVALKRERIVERLATSSALAFIFPLCFFTSRLASPAASASSSRHLICAHLALLAASAILLAAAKVPTFSPSGE